MVRGSFMLHNVIGDGVAFLGQTVARNLIPLRLVYLTLDSAEAEKV